METFCEKSTLPGSGKEIAGLKKKNNDDTKNCVGADSRMENWRHV